MSEKYLHRGADLDPLAEAIPSLDDVLSRRVNADPENVERGLAQLVLTIIELLRQLMERQALRRIDDGTLSEAQVERLGQTFMALADRMEELRTEFGLDEQDLNLNLGPLGRLL
jgi:Gas vesicle protein K